MGKKKIAAGGGFEGRTYESLLMAARAAKTPEQKRSVLIQLNQVTANLTQKDIATWRTAWQMAINVETPKRSKLYDCYTDALIDLHLTGCMGQRDGKTLQKKFVLRTRDGKEDVEAKRCSSDNGSPTSWNTSSNPAIGGIRSYRWAMW